MRMGGGDKARCDIAGSTMLDRVIARVAPQCEGLVLNANGNPARWETQRWETHGIPVIQDGLAGRQGPLAGLLAGFDWLAADRPDLEWLLSVSIDCPFLPNDLVARLHEARATQNVPLAIAMSAGRTHPVIAIWHISLREDLRDALDRGNRKAGAFVERHAHATAEWPTEPLDPFFNVNTPADLIAAQRLASIADRSV